MASEALASLRLERKPLAEQAYEQLRAAIGDGRLKAGTRLVERELCDELGVSRTPLREAMIRLQQDGLLTSLPKGGMVITSVNADEAEEIWAIRIPLESFAAALAASNRGEQTLEELRAITVRQRHELAVLNRASLADWNDRFHEVLYQASEKRRLIELIWRYRQYATEYRLYDVYSEDELQAGVGDHEDIVHALERRDAEATEELTRRHLLRGQVILREKRIPEEHA